MLCHIWWFVPQGYAPAAWRSETERSEVLRAARPRKQSRFALICTFGGGGLNQRRVRFGRRLPNVGEVTRGDPELTDIGRCVAELSADWAPVPSERSIRNESLVTSQVFYSVKTREKSTKVVVEVSGRDRFASIELSTVSARSRPYACRFDNPTQMRVT